MQLFIFQTLRSFVCKHPAELVVALLLEDVLLAVVVVHLVILEVEELCELFSVMLYVLLDGVVLMLTINRLLIM